MIRIFNNDVIRFADDNIMTDNNVYGIPAGSTVIMGSEKVSTATFSLSQEDVEKIKDGVPKICFSVFPATFQDKVFKKGKV